MIRVLAVLIALYIAYRLVKAAVFPRRKIRGRRPEDDAGEAGGAELTQDPQCGVYFLRHKGVEARVKGETLHFCSEKCRDAYLKDHEIPGA